MAFEDYVNRPEPDAMIWRYMDFTKFVSLLDQAAVFFCQVNQLGDKYEGSSRLFSDFGEEIDPQTEYGQMHLAMYNHPRGPRAWIVVNCWHINAVESAAMWQMYSARGQGVAITSTSNKLGQSLHIRNGATIYAGKVNYHPIKIIPGAEGFSASYTPFFKRRSFEYENEFRVALEMPGALNELEKSGGLYVLVDINGLIDGVYIAPHSPPWFTDLVESVSQRFGLRAKVTRSDIDSDPLY